MFHLWHLILNYRISYEVKEQHAKNRLDRLGISIHNRMEFSLKFSSNYIKAYYKSFIVDHINNMLEF